MQIRFIMAERNTWKMSFEELHPMVSFLNPDLPTIRVQLRFELLAEFNLLKLTMTPDEDHIVDVEMPVVEPMDFMEALDA
jgi:hypothetical protein